MIAPVRGTIKKAKKERDKWKTISWIFIISFVAITSIYLSYWYLFQYPEEVDKNKQAAIEFNQSLINQGIQEAYDLVEILRINCEPLILNYTNENNQSIILTYWPVEGCMSQDQINCILEDAP